MSSRKDSRELSFYKTAENGAFSVTLPLYKSEWKWLVKNGFTVEPHHDTNSKVKCKISWNNAFSTGMPAIIKAYLEDEIKTYCSKDLNFAQELYVISFKNLK